jgi:hypothetical protein
MIRIAPSWTPAEDAALRATWLERPIEEVLRAVGGRRTRAACRKRAALLRLRRINRGGLAHTRQWRTEDDAILRAGRAGGETFLTISKRIGVSKNACIGRLHRLNRRAKETAPPAVVQTRTAWGREIDRSSGFPMPKLSI